MSSMTASTDDKPDRVEVGGYVFERAVHGAWYVSRRGAFSDERVHGGWGTALIDALLAARAEVDADKYQERNAARADERALIRDALLAARAETAKVLGAVLLGVATCETNGEKNHPALIAYIEAAIANGPAPAPDPRREELAAFMDRQAEEWDENPDWAAGAARFREIATMLRGGH